MEHEKENSSHAQSALAPVALLGILVSYLAILRYSKNDARKSVHPQQASPNKRNNMNGSISPDLPPTPSQRGDSHGGENDTARWKKVAEIVIALSTAGLLIVNLFLWRVTADSLGLTRQAVEASYAGIIVPDITISFEQVAVTFVNKGKGPASGICAKYTVIRETLPQENMLEAVSAQSICDSISQTGEGPSHYTELPRFTKDDWENFLWTRQAIKVFGTFEYYNGFEQVGPQPFCLMISGQRGGNPGRFPCTGLNIFLNSLLTPEERWKRKSQQ